MEESSKQVNKKKSFDFSRYGRVISFLAMEILAFISFSLGNSYIFYSILSLVLFVLLLFVTFQEIKKEGLPSFIFFLFPLLIFGILSALSNFNKDVGATLTGFGLVFIPLGLTLFAACGYLAAHEKHFDISKALLVIYSALAIYVFINFLATMIQFAPFHTLTYRGMYIYYNGSMTSTSVSDMACALVGFSFAEVNIYYYTMFPVLLLSSALFLFFIKYKENRKLFVIYAAFTGLAVLAIIFSITKATGLLLLGVIILLALVLLVSKGIIKPNVLKIITISVGVIVGLVFIIFLINSQYVAGYRIGFIQNMISSNSLLNKIFTTNPIVQRMNIAFDGLFSKYKIFGLFTGYVQGFTDTYAFSERYTLAQVYPTGSWFADTILTAGTFGFIFLMVALVIAVIKIYKYCKNSGDLTMNKAIIIGFIITLFAYGMLGYQMKPFVFKNDLYPFNINNLFMIAFFLMGYCCYKGDTDIMKLYQKEEKEETIFEELKTDETSI